MTQTQSVVEADLLRIFRTLPEKKRTEILKFVSTIDRECREEKGRTTRTEYGEKTVEKTWGCIHLNRETLMHIAEDKELEYDF